MISREVQNQIAHQNQTAQREVQNRIVESETETETESEPLAIKKKDFYELLKSSNDKISSIKSENIDLKVKLEINEDKTKMIMTLLEKEKLAKESLETRIKNRAEKASKSSAEYDELLKKSRERIEYLEKNEEKLIKMGKEKMRHEIEEFKKKYGIPI